MLCVHNTVYLFDNVCKLLCVCVCLNWLRDHKPERQYCCVPSTEVNIHVGECRFIVCRHYGHLDTLNFDIRQLIWCSTDKTGMVWYIHAWFAAWPFLAFQCSQRYIYAIIEGQS